MTRSLTRTLLLLNVFIPVVTGAIAPSLSHRTLAKDFSIRLVSPEPDWRSVVSQRNNSIDAGLSIAVESIYPADIDHGTPVPTFRIRNNENRLRRLNLEFDPLMDNRRITIRRSVTLEPMGEVRLALPVPYKCERYYYGRNATLVIHEAGSHDAPWVARPYYGSNAQDITFDRGGYRSHPSGRTYQILLGRRFSPEKFRADLSVPTPGKKSDAKSKSGAKEESEPEQISCEILQLGNFTPGDWPTDWRVYSTFDAVFIASDDYAALSPEAREALDVFHRLGGALCIAEPNADNGVGASQGAKFHARLKTAFKRQGDRYVFVYNPDYVQTLRELPIKDIGTAPIGLLVSFLALFALILVPFLVIRAARRNTRLALLARLPIAATALAALIVAAIFLSFGITPTLRMQSVTLLDQGAKTATTKGQFGIFSPVDLDGLLSIPSDASFAFLLGETDDSVGIESGESQRLTGAWTRPLTLSVFGFTRHQHRSERLDFKTNPDGTVTAVNLLGAPVAELKAALGGRIYRFTSLAPGASATAAPDNAATFQPAADAETAFGVPFSSDWPERLSFLERPMLADRTYIARLEASPFFPSPLGTHRTHADLNSLVFGVLAPEAAK